MKKVFLIFIVLLQFYFITISNTKCYGEFKPENVRKNSLGQLDNWHHWERGLEHIKNKWWEQAEKEFNYYFRHADLHRHMFGIAYFGRGLMFQAMGHYDIAITEFKKAIENDHHPDVSIKDKAYMNIGTIYMEKKEYQDSIKAYSRAVESNPRNGLAHYYFGLALLHTGDYEGAGKEAEEAKRLGVPFTALSDKLNEIKNKTANPADTGKKK